MIVGHGSCVLPDHPVAVDDSLSSADFRSRSLIWVLGESVYAAGFLLVLFAQVLRSFGGLADV